MGRLHSENQPVREMTQRSSCGGSAGSAYSRPNTLERRGSLLMRARQPSGRILGLGRLSKTVRQRGQKAGLPQLCVGTERTGSRMPAGRSAGSLTRWGRRASKRRLRLAPKMPEPEDDKERGFVREVLNGSTDLAVYADWVWLWLWSPVCFSGLGNWTLAANANIDEMGGTSRARKRKAPMKAICLIGPCRVQRSWK